VSPAEWGNPNSDSSRIHGMEKITSHDPIDDVTSIPHAFKHRAVIRLLGAKMEHEVTPCGLSDILDALAYGEDEASQVPSNFLQESLEDPRVRPHRSKI
jgi:hypothetical protein